uniref:Glutathione S-transferase 8 n=1 Tax=Subpsaltria yangi TaxID=1195109 RepID=A0A2L1DG93_9HEMI|nr:glutathione S-transferase 8 [Subpsaltria yangi]AVC68806.1 glutathione S-transferase 9 [Subpsaltria yangi]
MPLVLYYSPCSTPCQAIMLTAKALGLDLELKLVDLWKGETLKPEFLKINPQHAVPVLDDNGFKLTESRAITTYLVEKYGKDDALYPKDPQKRAVVNQRLYFDIGTLYQRFADYHYPVMFEGHTYEEGKKKKLDEAYGYLDKFLENSTWAAGDSITIADISLATSVATAVDVTEYDISPYPHVTKWFEKAKSTLQGYDEIVKPGTADFRKGLGKD